MTEPTIQHTDDLKAALSRVTFKNTVLDWNWRFNWERNGWDGWIIWASFDRPDTLTGEISRGQGRRELIAKGTTLSGVVKTAWLLVELIVRHELMEGFRFDGVRIFNPHNSVLDLAKVQELHDQRVGLPVV